MNRSELEKAVAKYCDGVACHKCDHRSMDMCKVRVACCILEKEGILEKELDFGFLKVDDLIMVSDSGFNFLPRYFAKYENGTVYCWDNGSTSITANGLYTAWKYAKSYKEEK